MIIYLQLCIFSLVSHTRVFTWRRWSVVMRSSLNDIESLGGGIPQQFYGFLLGAAKAALIEIPS